MISSILGVLRDAIKCVYLLITQAYVRLFCVEREVSSWISLAAMLDVIPQEAAHKRHRLVLGKKSFICRWCVVNTYYGDVILKEGSGLGIGSIVIGPVTIGKNARCSQNCFISGESHLYEDISRNFLHQGCKIAEVVIEENVWVGSNCVVLPGIRIGKNSVIGAGSVVAQDIPAFSVAVGNPAVIVKQYDFNKNTWMQTQTRFA